MKMVTLFTLVLVLGLFSCAQPAPFVKELPVAVDPDSLEHATFAGGCFWCMEHPFEEMDGVYTVISGFAGGIKENPSYKDVSSGTTNHIESVQITYDPTKISYETLLDIFWKQIDPTDDGGQFVDRGHQYTSAIFYHTEEQQKQAEASKQALEESGRYDKPLVTPIVAFTTFYPAEDYHQDYYKTNTLKYKFYRGGSGRDQYLNDIWGTEEPTNNKVVLSTGTPKTTSQTDTLEPVDLKKTLTAIQYKVTQEDGTEPAYDNEYHDNKEPGIYVDIVSGEALFSSTHKYDSGTGWPSFTQPLEAENIVEKKDYKLIIPRTEVRSKQADSHLGHIFKDGPSETGLRYCINSAAMRFVPKEDLAKEGYDKYLTLFA